MPTSSIDVFGNDFLSDQYAFHPDLRDAGPVVWLERYGVFAMARHAEVSAALKDHVTFSSGRGVGLSDFAHEEPWRPPSLLLETDPPVHDRTRGLMNKVVNLSAINRHIPRWAERADELVRDLVSRGRVDAIDDIAEIYPMMIFPDTIGLPVDGRHHLLDYAAVAFNAFGPRNALLKESLARAEAATEWVSHACKRASLTHDGWGMDVYRASDAGLCTSMEAERLVRSFLTAGIDTTVNGIGNMIYALAANPDEWRRLQGKPSLTKKAFEESLRWESTVQTFFRTTTRAISMAGSVIPKDAKVLLFLASANRDPRRWDQPDRFDITRSASGHVGFGFGIHQCLGQMVARIEAEQLLKAMLRHVADIVLLEPPSRRLNNTLRALNSVPIQVTGVSAAA